MLVEGRSVLADVPRNRGLTLLIVSSYLQDPIRIAYLLDFGAMNCPGIEDLRAHNHPA